MRKQTLMALIALLLVLSLGCVAWEQVTPMALVTPTPAPATPTPHPPVTVVTDVQDLQTQIEAVYASAKDSVVHIGVVTLAYDFFYNPIPQEGSGSGFVYDTAGHIVTNYHVIEGAQEVNVTFADGTSVPAQVVGSDPSTDLAVVKVDLPTASLRPLPLGDSTQLSVGQFVVAIGNPFGLDHTLTFGVISSLGRVIQSPDGRYIGEAIQTDAAINPGNSGGPLLDLSGNVIGVNAQIVSTSQSNAGIGFAIPARTVQRVVPQLIAKGYYDHPYIGVQYFPYPLSSQWARIFRDEAGVNVPDHGLMIADVVPGSPADKAGLRGGSKLVTLRGIRVRVGGDVIVALDGKPVKTAQDLQVYLDTYKQVGDTLNVTVLRDGQELNLPVTLAARPRQ